jgi:nitrogen fixation/metabolism regulation signal transduction histidine kinase
VNPVQHTIPNDAQESRGPGSHDRSGGIGLALRWLWLGAVVPMLALTLLVVWLSGWGVREQITATLAALALAGVSGWLGTRRLIGPIRSVTNMLDAMRSGEFALRLAEPAGQGGRDDPLGGLVHSANRLGESMRMKRWSARETAALLDVLLARLDAAVMLIDENGLLVSANPSACGLLDASQSALIGRSSESLGLSPFVQARSGSVIDHAFATRAGRWEVRRAAVRLDGREHELLVVSDLTRTLRDEERRAWERLVQVLRHEVNNSLAPITSLAGSLARRVERTGGALDPTDEEATELLSDLGEGLGVIASRSGGLTRFLAAYTRLSRLPEPALVPRPIGPLVRRIAALQTAVPVAVPLDDGPSVLVDAAQIEQALLNLVTNAAEATLERYPNAAELPGITIEWSSAPSEPGFLEVRVEDHGIGLPETENLFVPFFTTKPAGTGIGLVLSRRIIEAHGGRLTLQAGAHGDGCVSSLTLRLSGGAAPGSSQELSVRDDRRSSAVGESAVFPG